MKIKTADLIDQTLDYAVAICRGKGIEFDCPSDPWLTVDGIADRPLHSYTPSTDWLIGGPIIERERINLNWGPRLKEIEWEATDSVDAQGRALGPTPLSAAMRCFVTSRLGEEVDVPEELLK